jgi:hypothetical protein
MRCKPLASLNKNDGAFSRNYNDSNDNTNNWGCNNSSKLAVFLRVERRQ